MNQIATGIGFPETAKRVNDEIESLRAKIADLTARLEAQKEGEPVAWMDVKWIDGFPTKHYAEEWFIARTKYRDRVVLRALPEEYTYDFTTADGTFMMKENVVQWMQFPDSEFTAPQPTPTVQAAVAAALRKAEEVCGKYVGAEGSAMRVQMERELARIPHDDSALRAICMRVAVEINSIVVIQGSKSMDDLEAIVNRVLGEKK